MLAHTDNASVETKHLLAAEEGAHARTWRPFTWHQAVRFLAPATLIVAAVWVSAISGGRGYLPGQTVTSRTKAVLEDQQQLVAAQCAADTQDACLKLGGGCYWFSYTGDCPNCEKWVSQDAGDVTGCRDWDPFNYCEHQILTKAVEASKKDRHDPDLADVVQHYHVARGVGSNTMPFAKKMFCNVWCDKMEGSSCFGQPKAYNSLRGVNYGGRFVPEEFLGLYGTGEYMYKGVEAPNGSRAKSICDIKDQDAGSRMSLFLDDNIKEEHFTKIVEQGFNVIRLPLGYWNLIDLPPGQTPDGPPEAKKRWARIQGFKKAAEYRKWIDRVFEFADKAGLKVMPDLHSAPGGQSGNECTGCDQGPTDAIFWFLESDGSLGRNTVLAQNAITEMAKLCASKGDTCYGIELLNEPYGAHIDTLFDEPLRKDLEACPNGMLSGKDDVKCNGLQMFYTAEQLKDTKDLIAKLNASRKAKKTQDAPHVQPLMRESLREFYKRSMTAARAVLDKDKPIVIMDWPQWLKWWLENAGYTYADHGRVIFSTHTYKFPDPMLSDQQAARDYFNRDLQVLRDFWKDSDYELVVSEWALNSHGSGKDGDKFDYSAFAHWAVNQYNQFGLGSTIWNFDSYWAAWGSVATSKVGNVDMDWPKTNNIAAECKGRPLAGEASGSDSPGPNSKLC